MSQNYGFRHSFLAATDGTTFCVLEYDSAPAQSAGWVIVVPGGKGLGFDPKHPEVYAQSTLHHLCQRMVEGGYRVCTFNSRGQPPSAGTRSHEKAEEDLGQLIHHLTQHHEIGPKGIGIIGKCVGGAIAMSYATKNSWRVAFVVGYGTPPSLSEEVRGQLLQEAPDVQVDPGARLYQAGAIIKEVKDVPCLLIGSIEDTAFFAQRTGEELSWQVIQKDLAVTHPLAPAFDLIFLPTGGHGLDKDPSIFEWLKGTCLTWATQHLHGHLSNAPSESQKLDIALHLHRHMNDYARDHLADMRGRLSIAGVVISVVSLAAVELFSTTVLGRIALTNSFIRVLGLALWVIPCVLVCIGLFLLHSQAQKAYGPRQGLDSTGPDLFRANTYRNWVNEATAKAKDKPTTAYSQENGASYKSLREFRHQTSTTASSIHLLMRDTTLIGGRLGNATHAAKFPQTLLAAAAILISFAMIGLFLAVFFLPDADVDTGGARTRIAPTILYRADQMSATFEAEAAIRRDAFASALLRALEVTENQAKGVATEKDEGAMKAIAEVLLAWGSVDHSKIHDGNANEVLAPLEQAILHKGDGQNPETHAALSRAGREAGALLRKNGGVCSFAYLLELHAMIDSLEACPTLDQDRSRQTRRSRSVLASAIAVATMVKQIAPGACRTPAESLIRELNSASADSVISNSRLQKIRDGFWQLKKAAVRNDGIQTR